MKELNTDDPEAIRAAGAIDLPTVQRYLNFWFSSSLDLFGSESSSNAASYFANGLKGRPDESRYEDHIAADQIYTMEVPDGNLGTKTERIPMRNAMNDVTRGSYVKDCEMGVTALEPADREGGTFFPPGAAEHAFSPQHRNLGRRADRSLGQADHAGGIQCAHWQLAAERSRSALTS